MFGRRGCGRRVRPPSFSSFSSFFSFSSHSCPASMVTDIGEKPRITCLCRMWTCRGVRYAIFVFVNSQLELVKKQRFLRATQSSDRQTKKISAQVCAHTFLRSYRRSHGATLLGRTIPNLTQFGTSLTIATYQFGCGRYFFGAKRQIWGQNLNFKKYCIF